FSRSEEEIHFSTHQCVQCATWNAKMTTDTLAQTADFGVTTFTPCKADFKDFVRYVAFMESQGAHRAGMAKESQASLRGEVQGRTAQGDGPVGRPWGHG
ncbi:hypothetical protein CHARACLAT_026396, partial [Characodon lateralis]|nr:hypothetical protein [Characodon lateralis]